MIDAGPSLRLAEKLTAPGLSAYLTGTGWRVRSSRVEGVNIWSKSFEGMKRPVKFVLPAAVGSADEKTRIADALRGVAAVEGSGLEEVAERAIKAGRVSVAADA